MQIKDGSGHCPQIAFSPQWQVLGPFQIGTREASWGADPLEYLGGFRSLCFDEKAKYPSSLATEGHVTWSCQRSETLKKYPNAVETILKVEFPDLNWQSLRSVYGWTVLQYQAWARGFIAIESEFSETLSLYTDEVLEFWINGNHYFGGDFYGYRKAPLVLSLSPGSHRVDIRLIRDLRAMGGVGDPNVSLKLKAEGATGGLALLPRHLLMSDIVNGMLASPLVSVPARNESYNWIQIIKISSYELDVAILETLPLRIAPGQTRPLGFSISAKHRLGSTANLMIHYANSEDLSEILEIELPLNFDTKPLHSPHKFTFRHPSGIVSYGVLRPPSSNIAYQVGSRHPLPILLSLHGAGVEADNHQVVHAFDSIPDIPAWVLFPSGVTPWCGDDWHTWGFADIEAGAKAIEDWITHVGWNGVSVDSNRWLVSGHSNGGQGAYYALTHRPDNVIGAAVVSGYSSIQGYVAYQMWRETDPRITFLLQSTLLNFRHELLIANFAGIPTILQHGSKDDNVPAFHSRRMNQLICQSGGAASSSFVELAGKGHVFDGMMTTAPLQKFYYDLLNGDLEWPVMSRDFSIIIANPAEMGSRGGLIVDQLKSPDRLGRIDITRRASSDLWTLKTSNIRRFHLSSTEIGNLPSEMRIDENIIQLPANDTIAEMWFIRGEAGPWTIVRDNQWLSKERHGRRCGTLDAILRSSGRFLIHYESEAAHEIALQTSRNLYQYFSADSEITGIRDTMKADRGNVISISIGRSLPPSFIDGSFPVNTKEDQGLCICDSHNIPTVFEFEEGLGVIMLRPLPDERLELVIWGFDSLGLRLASRLFPILTGAGQPEFIIVSRRCAWDGADGVLAMGRFDYQWLVSESSYIA